MVHRLVFFFKQFLLLLFVIAWSTCSVYGAEKPPTPPPSQNYVMGATVTNVVKGKHPIVEVLITDGQYKGKKFAINNTIQTPYDINYEVGDHVVVSYNKDASGRESIFITDFQRTQPMLLLTILFLILTIAIARWQGISSLIGMVFSFFIIGKFIIPSIVIGNDPLLITIFGSLFIIPVTFYIAHGINKKATIAVVSTLLCIILIAALSVTFVKMTKLTGFADEEAVYLQAMGGGAINITSLLLAGIIIGGLAVLNDITIAQASTVNELYGANRNLTIKEAYNNAMGVGRDHVASLVNTLVLVYAGASLPLFLLFYNSNVAFGSVLNQEIIATEIVRTLVSSIGIVAAVPITTIMACVFLRRK